MEILNILFMCYTKGESDYASMRISQVHTITMFCPLQDKVVSDLMRVFDIIVENYKSDDGVWKNVPAIEALRCFLMTIATSDEGDREILDIISASLKAFPRLKRITFVFTYDENVYKSYRDMIDLCKNDMKNAVFRIDVVEMNLSDMFIQEIIDKFNKVLMINEIISNSYLNRSFRIDFTYDEYITFMDMFLGNYGPELNRIDGNICDCFRSFPPLVEMHKPEIRIITNYSEL